MHSGRLTYVFFFLLCTIIPALGQGIEVEFGKNRVQHHDDFRNWWRYESENFITYWYGKARHVAQASMQMAEMDFEKIVNIIEHRSNAKIEIIAYVDITDMKQSNIGSEEQFSHTAGQTKIVGNKMFVYFNGDHQHLHRQIRGGMARIIMNNMLYGGNIQEIVQNAVFLNVPEWFSEGLISYISSDWDTEIDGTLKTILRKEEKKEFNNLAYRYPVTIGHSFWYFLADKYGSSSIANILYLTRINRDLDNAFLYVVGASLDRLIEEWQLYYEPQMDIPLMRGSRPFPFKVKKGRVLTHVLSHPDKRHLIYATNEMGKIRLYKTDGKKSKCFFKTGYCNQIQSPDLNYPIMSFSPEGDELYIIYEKRDILKLRKYRMSDMAMEEQIIPTDIQRIYDLCISEDGNLYFSGANNGLSDIFMYQPKNRQYLKLTDDFYDDLELEYYSDGQREGLLFLSNRDNPITLPNDRLKTTLPIANSDVFFLDLESSQDPIKRITQNRFGNKKEIQLDNSNNLIYLSSKSGNWNARKIDLKEVFRQIDLGGTMDYGFDGQAVSDYAVNIHLYYYNPSRKQWYHVFDELEQYVQVNTDKSYITEIENSSQDKPNENIEVPNTPLDSQYFDVSFENPEFIKPKELPIQEATPDEIAEYQNRKDNNSGAEELNFSRAVASRLRFRIDYFNTNLDNSLLFGGLDTYAGEKMEFNNPPLGILLKANLKDIFEDYVVEGGTRITTSFNGSEHFLRLSDKKFRIDKHYSIYRRAIRELIDRGEYAGYRGRNITFIGVFEARYPFDVYRSLRGSTTFRNDRFNILASDRQSLNAPSVDEQRLGFRLEYVFDNTIDRSLNIKNGTRYKVFSEVVKRFAVDLAPFNLDFSDGFMTVMGFDFRHYVPVLKHSVLAVRAHGSTSFGSERILFYAGGMENWLFPSFNNSTSFPTEDNYAYQTIATNIRGFDYNIRNGGTFGIINTEFRLPIMPYITRKKLRFAPLQNLQFSTFFDVGLAWFGVNPVARDNPANSGFFSNPAVSIDVEYYRDPLIMSYGWGVRTLIFGYYLKFDYGYGIETRRVQDPVWHLSLGKDF